jgi:mono/diheme cytochrome c family protein
VPSEFDAWAGDVPAPDAAPPARPPAAPLTSADAGDSCDELAQRWSQIAATQCAACHGANSPAKAGFSTVLDTGALIASGKIVPREPDRSPLYVKVSSGQMPPEGRTPRPSDDDIQTLRAWISCGAPAFERPVCTTRCTSFLDIDARVGLMLKDAQNFETPEERADVRYLDLSNYANAGHGEPELELYRGALSFMLNALSSGPRVVLPQIVDGQGLIFRVRLGDYGWTASDWENISAGYPYGVRYSTGSRAFPHNEPLAEALRDTLGTATPYLQADWFLTQVIHPPLYYQLLRVPESLADLQKKLGIDIQADIAGQRAVRAGFTDSGPSHFNRVIERHALPDARGALWLTYDFSTGSGNANVLTHPLDFTQQSNEILFDLPNGFSAYMICDAAGTRLDRAPNDAVQDPRSRDLAIEAGISCVSCHAQQGLLAHDDEVRARSPLASADSGEVDAVLQLYVAKDKFDALMSSDQSRYQGALGAARARSFGLGSAHQLDDAFRGLLSLADIAGVLGIEEAALAAAIDATPRVYPPEI